VLLLNREMHNDTQGQDKEVEKGNRNESKSNFTTYILFHCVRDFLLAAN